MTAPRSATVSARASHSTSSIASLRSWSNRSEFHRPSRPGAPRLICPSPPARPTTVDALAVGSRPTPTKVACSPLKRTSGIVGAARPASIVGDVAADAPARRSCRLHHQLLGTPRRSSSPVSAIRLAQVKVPARLTRCGLELFARMASPDHVGEMPRAAIWSGSSETRMANVAVRRGCRPHAYTPSIGAEARLHHPRQIVGDLVRRGRRGEPQVHRRELVVGGLQLDDRGLGLRRELVADLRRLGPDLGERGIGVEVELQVRLVRRPLGRWTTRRSMPSAEALNT